MRISDWSSDVCSSDLPSLLPVRHWSAKSLHDREECPKCQRSSPPCLIRYIRLPTCDSCSPISCASLLTSCGRKRFQRWACRAAIWAPALVWYNISEARRVGKEEVGRGGYRGGAVP